MILSLVWRSWKPTSDIFDGVRRIKIAKLSEPALSTFDTIGPKVDQVTRIHHFCEATNSFEQNIL